MFLNFQLQFCCCCGWLLFHIAFSIFMNINNSSSSKILQYNYIFVVVVRCCLLLLLVLLLKRIELNKIKQRIYAIFFLFCFGFFLFLMFLKEFLKKKWEQKKRMKKNLIWQVYFAAISKYLFSRLITQQQQQKNCSYIHDWFIFGLLMSSFKKWIKYINSRRRKKINAMEKNNHLNVSIWITNSNEKLWSYHYYSSSCKNVTFCCFLFSNFYSTFLWNS